MTWLGQWRTSWHHSHFHYIIVSQDTVEDPLYRNNHLACLLKYRFPGATVTQLNLGMGGGGLEWESIFVIGIYVIFKHTKA